MTPATATDTTLLLTHAALAGRVPETVYIDAVQAAFRQWGEGRLKASAVGHVPCVGGAVHIKPAASDTRIVVKINANFPGNPANYGLPTIQGVVALIDARTGRFLALMDSSEITAQRTAAASAVAAKFLARSQSSTLGFIGAGLQARYHLPTLCCVIPMREVVCCDPNADNVQHLAALAAARGMSFRVCATPREVAQAADVLVTCTPSRQALVNADDVRPGTFIAAVGADNADKQELSVELMRRARVVPDVLAQAAHMGDLHHALAEGVMREADIHGELADVVMGHVPARNDDEAVFVFDSTGVAIEDLAAAERLYEHFRDDVSVPRIAFHTGVFT